MFDLKKRNSLTLKSGRDSEEFRRVAVRRKVVRAVGDCPASDVSSGVSGSYSRGRACDGVCGLGPDLNESEKSPAKRSPLKPQVPPKPAHLQSPQRPGPGGSCSPTKGRVGPHRLHVTVWGKGDRFPNGAPVRPSSQAQWLNPPGPVLGSPSPGKRGIRRCSPLREGGHSPAKLSPRNRSPLMGKPGTAASPAQGRLCGYTPAKNSKSWLGLNGIPTDGTEKREKSVGKSLSVPDLIVYMDESSVPNEKVERSPLKLLLLPNCNASAAAIKASAKHRLSYAANERHLSGGSREPSPGRMNGTMEREEWFGVDGEESETPTGHDSQCSCLWPEVETGGHSEKPRGDQNEEEGGGGETRDEDTTELKLYKIANEVLQTERAYVARLHLLDQVFCSRLTEEAGRGSFPPDVIRNIFSNISSIYSFHSQFLLPDLEKCLCHWGESSGLGGVLLQHAPFLRMYADYVKNFDQAMELVRTWTERSSAFRNIIQDIQSQEVCGSLTLQHHMLEPVQRVPRYEMLLKDYLKRLPEENPDYEFAQKSLQAISMAATHSNKAIHKAENLKRLLEIYEMLGEEEEVVNPTNEFLRQGRLLKLAARNTSAMERHLFLFNNFLLCCSPRFSLVGQRFAVRCRIGVEGMQVQESINEDHPYTFQVSGKERILELQANSEQERDEWIKVIQKAIDEFQKKNETFKMASKEANVEAQGEELGRRAPRWIRDNEVTLCMSCWEPFNALTRRRHHCRACGFVVCWRCSDNKVALEYDGNRLNKVCKSCYSILTGQRGERADGKKRRILEAESSPGSGDCLMSGFLRYGDDPVTDQRPWSVVTRTDPPVLHLYALPKDVKPLFSIPLPGCHVDASPPELPGQHSFCLSQSRATHTFSCDGADLKQSWLTVLKAAAAATGRTPARSLSVPESAGARSGNERSSVMSGNKENRS